MTKSGLILVNKSAGMSSHDVVNRLRRILDTRKVGHCGTLDEMATGVLPVCFGRATRACDYAQSADKTYRASLRFGMTSSTQDIWGDITETGVSQVTREMLESLLPSFLGPQDQLPPMVSALKQNGVRLYTLAREGIEVHREPRRITILKLELISFSPKAQEAEILVDCSKGTYIRTLCHDIGDALGCGAVMSALCRERNGNYSIDECLTLDELWAHKDEGTLESCIRPVDSIFRSYPAYTLSCGEEEDMRVGRVFPTTLSPGRYRAYSNAGEFIGLCLVEEGIFSLIKGFYETKGGMNE